MDKRYKDVRMRPDLFIGTPPIQANVVMHSMQISMVARKQKSRTGKLGGKYIDVTPGSGAVDFSFTPELWNAFVRYHGTHGRISEDWWTVFEIAMWELAIKKPANWLMLRQSSELILTDVHPKASQTNPRVITALCMARVLQAMGQTVVLGSEYSTPEWIGEFEMV